MIIKGRKCKHCSTTSSPAWCRDQWGEIGWYCHDCYNAITLMERRLELKAR
jgi:hypothetical protein